jgi:hypothetical protein
MDDNVQTGLLRSDGRNGEECMSPIAYVLHAIEAPDRRAPSQLRKRLQPSVHAVNKLVAKFSESTVGELGVGAHRADATTITIPATTGAA